MSAPGERPATPTHCTHCKGTGFEWLANDADHCPHCAGTGIRAGGESVAPTPPDDAEWVYGEPGIDDLERELSRRRNAIGEGTLAAQMTNGEFFGLLRTARSWMRDAVRLEHERDDAQCLAASRPVAPTPVSVKRLKYFNGDCDGCGEPRADNELRLGQRVGLIKLCTSCLRQIK